MDVDEVSLRRCSHGLCLHRVRIVLQRARRVTRTSSVHCGFSGQRQSSRRTAAMAVLRHRGGRHAAADTAVNRKQPTEGIAMKSNPRFTKLAAVAALAALPTLAAAHNYSYLEGGYVNRDNYGTNDDNENGFRIGGSGDVHSNVALIGEYGSTGDIDQISAGAQFHAPINPMLDFTAGATAEHVDIDSADDTGYGLRSGVRWQTADGRFELWPEVRYIDVFDDDATSARLGGAVAVNNALDVTAAAQGGDDDRYEVGLRYNFGPRLTTAAR